MTVEEAMEWGKTLDFPTVWASIERLGARVDQTSAIIESLGARIDQIAVRVAETTANVDKMAAKVDRVTENAGGLNRSIGELIETLMSSGLCEKFSQYNFSRLFPRIKLFDEKKVLLTDIDMLLSNTEWCMAVEVKREPDEEDVKHHLKRMKLMRKYPLDEIKGKRLLGAIAGGVVPKTVGDYAHKCGFFVLELNGEQVSLVESPQDFEPYEV